MVITAEVGGDMSGDNPMQQGFLRSLGLSGRRLERRHSPADRQGHDLARRPQ
jgi:hypothetical protein